MKVNNLENLLINPTKANFANKGANITLPDNNATKVEYEKAAKEFEALFLSQMLNYMFENVKFNPSVNDKATEKVYKSMLIDEYAKSMSNKGGIGIADHVMNQLIKLQNVNGK